MRRIVLDIQPICCLKVLRTLWCYVVILMFVLTKTFSWRNKEEENITVDSLNL